MDILSSSFLQKYNSTSSLSASPSLVVLRFKISSVQTDENQSSSPERKMIFMNPRKSSAFRTSHHVAEQKSGQSIRKKEQSLLRKILNSLDDFICDFTDPPLSVSVDPSHVLSDNFAPVDEFPPTACELEEGSLPPCLDGAYIRNGPNPQFFPQGPYHLFDGDGMLHSVKISGGKATFCSRFVKTYKYSVEREMGSPVFLNVFSACLVASLARCAVTLIRVLAGKYNLLRRGIGYANTSLVMFSGKLFALGETDLPYRIKITPNGDIITLGRHESFGKQPFATMTAHPKIDAETGEVFAYRQSLTLIPPFIVYFKINRKGEKQPEVPIFSIKGIPLLHDFAISKTYAIFLDGQIVIEPVNILKGLPVMGVDPKKVSRLGIIPRNAVDGKEMRWVDVPGFNMIHAVNAWDEDGGDTVVMVAGNVLGVKHFLNRMDLIHVSMERIEINVKEKSVKRRQVLLKAYLELPLINPAFVGKKNSECTVATRMYEPSCYGNETVFVPIHPENPTTEEDDGYLLTYIHNEITGELKFIIMDAKTPGLEIVFIVKLPARVPYGLYGIFVPHKTLINVMLNPNAPFGCCD